MRDLRRTTVTAVVVMVAGLLVPVAASSASTWILNQPQTDRSSGLGFYRYSPDGKWVVYTANEREPDVGDVWSVPVTGGDPVRLSRYTTDPGNGPQIGITPDSRRAVWVVDADDTLESELYSAPVGGGPQVKLNDPLVHDGKVSHEFLISPVDQRVVYRATQHDPDRMELFSVPADRSQHPVRLSPDLDGGSVGSDWRLTPDGSRAVFVADPGGQQQHRLFSVPVEGGEPLELSAPLADGESVTARVFVAPDGSRVVWRVQDAAGAWSIWSSPVDRSQPVQLSSGLDVAVTSFRFSDDSRYVTFVANRDDTYELWSVEVAGGSDPVLLSSDQPVGTRVWDESHTADGRVVYRLGSQVLRIVPVTGGSPVTLDGTPERHGQSITRLRVTPDGTVAHYLYDGPDDDPDKQARTIVLPRGDPIVVGAEPTFINDVTPDSQYLLLSTDGQGYRLAPVRGGDGILFPMEPPADAAGYHLPRIGPNGRYVTAEATGLNLESAHLAATALPHVPPTVERIAGTDRYATAAALAARFDHAEVVYLATGAVFPDALAAGPAAAAEHAPILLTEPDRLPEPTVTQLRRLGPSTLVIVGGDAAVHPHVADQAAQAAGNARQVRVAGPDRYATAAQAARRTYDQHATTRVVLATGATYPDAIAGGPFAVATDAAVLLTDPEQLPGATVQALRDLAPASLVVLGGPAAVSGQVADAAADAAGTDNVTRHAGTDRYDTAAEVARAFPEAVGQVLLATGQDFPDAVAATPLAARHGAPIVLTPTDTLATAARDAATALDPATVQSLGGTAAVSDTVLQQLRDTLR